MYHNSADDTSKIKSLFGICEYLEDDSWELYQIYQLELIEKSLDNNPSKKEKQFLMKWYADALNSVGFVYVGRNDIPKAIEYLEKNLTIELQNNNKEGIGNAYNNLGRLYENRGNISLALEYHHKSLKIRETLGDKMGSAISMNNIAMLIENQGDTDKAIELFEKSLAINKEIGNMNGASANLNNMGALYKKQNDIPKALEYYYQSLKIQEKVNNKESIAFLMNNIGGNLCEIDSIEKGMTYLRKALATFKEKNNYEGLSYSYQKIGVWLHHQHKNDSAKYYAQKSYDLATKIGFVENIKRAASLLSTIYEEENNHSKALEMYKIYISMSDSLNNKQTQKATAQQQAKYEYEKQKAIDDAEHEKQLAIEQEAKEKQQIITYSTVTGLVLVGFFLLVVFNRLKVTRKQKSIIENQKQEVEQQKSIVESAHHELEEKNKEITDSIQYAKRIQNAILPPDKLVKEYLENSFILYKPKDIVAGDFYWMESISSLEGGLKVGDNHPSNSHFGKLSAGSHGENSHFELGQELILFAAADCTGHGVPGAMVSVICNNGLNRSVREYGLTDPGKILDKTREIVITEFEKSEEEVKDGMDIALCSLQQMASGYQLKYAGAHNPLWIITSSLEGGKEVGEKSPLKSPQGDKWLVELKANKQPIGKFDNPEPYTTHTIELQEGDTIYIFSDGYVDQFGGEKGKKFKSPNFKKLLLSIQNENMETQKAIINTTFENWKRNVEQIDDVCIIGVRI